MAARRNLAQRRSRTAVSSRRCSGRMPLGPGADIARNRTPLSAGTAPAGASSDGAAGWGSAGGAMAAAGRVLHGRSAAPQAACASLSRSATLVCRELAALL